MPFRDCNCNNLNFLLLKKIFVINTTLIINYKIGSDAAGSQLDYSQILPLI